MSKLSSDNDTVKTDFCFKKTVLATVWKAD
jgi:hypothetical protein